MVGLSRTQGNVSLSSTKANYVAAGEVAKEMLLVRGILTVVHSDHEENITMVFEGGLAAIQLANNLLGCGRRMHIDVRH